MDDFIAYLRSEFNCRCQQYLYVYVWNDALSEHIDIRSDADLLEAFVLEKNRMVVVNVYVMDVAPYY